MNRRLVCALAILCGYASAALVATPFHLATEHHDEAGSDHDHDAEFEATGHDHAAIDHQQTGLKAPSSFLIPAPVTSINPIGPDLADRSIFIPPEECPHPSVLADHSSPRAPPAL